MRICPSRFPKNTVSLGHGDRSTAHQSLMSLVRAGCDPSKAAMMALKNVRLSITASRNLLMLFY